MYIVILLNRHFIEILPPQTASRKNWFLCDLTVKAFLANMPKRWGNEWLELSNRGLVWGGGGTLDWVWRLEPPGILGFRTENKERQSIKANIPGFKIPTRPMSNSMQTSSTRFCSSPTFVYILNWIGFGIRYRHKQSSHHVLSILVYL